MQDIKALCMEKARLSALLVPIEKIEESLATAIVVAAVSGQSATKLRRDFKLAKAWYDCGMKYYDSVIYDLDRLAEAEYDGTIPDWAKVHAIPNKDIWDWSWHEVCSAYRAFRAGSTIVCPGFPVVDQKWLGDVILDEMANRLAEGRTEPSNEDAYCYKDIKS